MASKETILVVDDIPDWIETCSDILGDEGFHVLTALSGEEALKVLENNLVDLVITDFVMTGMSGLELVQSITKRGEGTSVILMTSYPSVESAVDVLKTGASDYIIKPFTPDQLLHAVHNALDKGRLKRENQFLQSQMARQCQFGEMVGRSDVMMDLFKAIENAAKTDASVLVLGESGTGKELVAKMLHDQSPRNKNHFAPINCAAIPDHLLESELFGHKAGAFTGATEARVGLFENASGGTVFLDEIGDMPLTLQSKLLRVLEDHKVRRVGSNRERDIDVRFISATNVNLLEQVKEKKFREDLYYRLKVITIEIPPLRERKEDILLLLQHFFSMYESKNYKAPQEISPEARECLMKYKWPGNVRELSNMAQNIVYSHKSDILDVSDLPLYIGCTTTASRGGAHIETPDEFFSMPLADAKQKMNEQFEKEYLVMLLEKYDWNISQAATESKMERRTLHRLITKHNLKRPT